MAIGLENAILADARAAAAGPRNASDASRREDAAAFDRLLAQTQPKSAQPPRAAANGAADAQASNATASDKQGVNTGEGSVRKQALNASPAPKKLSLAAADVPPPAETANQVKPAPVAAERIAKAAPAAAMEKTSAPVRYAEVLGEPIAAAMTPLRKVAPPASTPLTAAPVKPGAAGAAPPDTVSTKAPSGGPQAAAPAPLAQPALPKGAAPPAAPESAMAAFPPQSGAGEAMAGRPTNANSLGVAAPRRAAAGGDQTPSPRRTGAGSASAPGAGNAAAKPASGQNLRGASAASAPAQSAAASPAASPPLTWESPMAEGQTLSSQTLVGPSGSSQTQTFSGQAGMFGLPAAGASPPGAGSPPGAPAQAGAASRIPLTAPALAHQIAKSFEGGETRMEIRLDPAELGKIEVRLEIAADNSVSAVVSAETPETLQELTRHARDLEEALNAAGLNVDAGGLSFQMSEREAGEDRSVNRRDGDVSLSAPAPDAAAAPAPRPFGLERWDGARVDLWA